MNAGVESKHTHEHYCVDNDDKDDDDDDNDDDNEEDRGRNILTEP